MTAEARKAALLERTSTAELLKAAAQLEALQTTTPEQRMTRAWILDEIEKRAGRITLDEEPEFERIYDETGDYLAALKALRPSLGA
ncbi:hypothetical protein I5G72_gp07 [Mycobacterium phage Collard]|uniref:Uncharacterized protein n=1 Tax=Mycobacterium phage Collard TaxID=2301704 RepID=A0A385DUX5_9CAUD|nr:hypothetical protein I5G72_gp07 [Mycobacterium phage Collard]AXQ63266.1 hypothetical protein SEA_COLLARD_92 [Mycobacterium phage Collard]UEM46485.1 hypothetical protein SEA_INVICTUSMANEO_91 [Mycobacterium phage InvictusManeo]